MQDDEDEKEPIRAYGFIEALAPPDAKETQFGRFNFLIDAIRAEAVHDGSAQRRLGQDLLIIRLMTTLNRLQERFPGIKWEEGTWVELHLKKKYCEPPVWFVSGSDNSGGPVQRTNLVDAMVIDGGGPSSTWKTLSALCAAGPQVRRAAPPSRSKANTADCHVRIVDVGQASFSVLHERRDPASEILGYFDVGAPVFFHHHTFPSAFPDKDRVPATGFVLLSHWDFDHYSLAVTKMSDLQNLAWYAPDQPVGPSAARLQAKLWNRLTLLSAPTYTVRPGLELCRGTGAVADRNGSGYALNVRRSHASALLPADIPYHLIPAQAKSDLGALAITHHGGTCVGAPPSRTKKGCVAAVSYGVPNRYHHPDPAAITQHATLGWSVQPTYKSASKRADVWL